MPPSGSTYPDAGKSDEGGVEEGFRDLFGDHPRRQHGAGDDEKEEKEEALPPPSGAHGSAPSRRGGAEG